MTGGRAALLAAYLERRPDLVRFFTARLKSAAAAEDLVQDIYLRIAASPPNAEVHNPAAYLYRLGTNLMLDRLRGERRTASREFAWRETHRTVVGQEEVAEDAGADDALAARPQLAAIVAADPAGVPHAQVRRTEPRGGRPGAGHLAQRRGEARDGRAEAARQGAAMRRTLRPLEEKRRPRRHLTEGPRGGARWMAGR